VGTEKRERQKANRAQRQQEQLKAASRKRGMRIAAIVVGGLVAVFGLVYIATLVTGDDDSDTSSTIEPVSTEVITSEPISSIVPVASEPATTESATSEPATDAAAPECPPVDGVAEPVHEFSAAPPMCLEEGATYQAVVTTNFGEYTADLDAETAPLAVNNFVFLARNGYYDETPCHRIIPGFVIQCGDPTGTGTGNPGYEFADELPEAGQYQLGSLAMANSGPDTNGSQFFVITGEQGVQLPPDYTLFGQVVEGFDTTVADVAATGTEGGVPSESVTITSVEIIQS
jgi:cyclophilin family peptidyl-prolyl cis-trans isomerase